jgi:hypothetical protein
MMKTSYSNGDPTQTTLGAVRFLLNVKAAASMAHLTAWVTQVLNASADELPNEDGTVPLRLAAGSLLMVRSLLQAISLPVFQVGRVVDIEPDARQADTFIVSAQLFYIDNTHPDCYLSHPG